MTDIRHFYIFLLRWPGVKTLNIVSFHNIQYTSQLSSSRLEPVGHLIALSQCLVVYRIHCVAWSVYLASHGLRSSPCFCGLAVAINLEWSPVSIEVELPSFSVVTSLNLQNMTSVCTHMPSSYLFLLHILLLLTYMYRTLHFLQSSAFIGLGFSLLLQAVARPKLPLTVCFVVLVPSSRSRIFVRFPSQNQPSASGSVHFTCICLHFSHFVHSASMA